MSAGKVWLVGAGPGDRGLLTLKGSSVLAKADIVAYDALVGLGVLSMIPSSAKKINVGKRSSNHTMPQEDISEMLARLALEGKNVVRLKGGDPFLFGRGGEELETLAKAGVAFEAVPGVPSPIAIAAYAGIPATHRDFASSLHIITAHTKEPDKELDYKSILALGGTLVFMMGLSDLEAIATGLINAGADPKTPAAVICEGTMPSQLNAVSDLEGIVEQAKRMGAKAPAIIYVGGVCSLAGKLGWREALPLSGVRAIVTRASANASSLAEALRDLGCESIELPSIKAELLPSGSLIAGIANYDWIALTSPTGVEMLFRHLDALGIDIRGVKAKFASIGKSTQAALRRYGILSEYTASESNGAAFAEGLSELVKPNQTLAIARAREGSSELTEALAQKGVNYIDIATYETLHVGSDVGMYLEAGFDYILFSSGSAVESFAASSPQKSFEGIKALCIGPTTAKTALGYGFSVEVSNEASIASMVEKLVSLAASRR
jgi:uroporphyrinogen III methyltransferase/synthase